MIAEDKYRFPRISYQTRMYQTVFWKRLFKGTYLVSFKPFKDYRMNAWKLTRACRKYPDHNWIGIGIGKDKSIIKCHKCNQFFINKIESCDISIMKRALR